jgi:hypothetical protein
MALLTVRHSAAIQCDMAHLTSFSWRVAPDCSPGLSDLQVRILALGHDLYMRVRLSFSKIMTLIYPNLSEQCDKRLPRYARISQTIIGPR